MPGLPWIGTSCEEEGCVCLNQYIDNTRLDGVKYMESLDAVLKFCQDIFDSIFEVQETEVEVCWDNKLILVAIFPEMIHF